jgi:drug/metabolite transporter (DMT)-like permease
MIIFQVSNNMPKSTIASPIKSLMLLILLGIVWGTGYSIARFAMTNEVPPLGYSFWQSLGPAIIIGTLSLLTTGKMTFSVSRIRFYLITGLTGIVIPNTTMYFAASHLPAGILAIVVNTVPIIAYPMALLAGIEKFKWERMAGIFMALTGLMLIILPKSSLPSADMVPWVISTLITPVSFAFCSIYISRYRPAGSDSLTLSAGMLIFSSLMLIPLVLITHSFYLFHLPLTAPDGVIILEILLSSLGYVLFFQLIKIAGPVYYSLVDTIVVLTGLFWGRVIFNEHLNQWTLTAVLFIVMALLLVTRYQRKRANSQQ